MYQAIGLPASLHNETDVRWLNFGRPFALKVGYPDFLSPCALGHQLFLSTKSLRIN